MKVEKNKMRVLWFAVTPSLYAQNNIKHNGGGWISSLEKIVKQIPEIELAIAFEHSDISFKVVRNGVTYYPISVWNKLSKRIKRKFFFDSEEKEIVPSCIKIINDFKPDIIHVFGSEWSFGLIASLTNIPLVIHMQGSIPPYLNAYFPPNYSLFDIILFNKLNIIESIKQIINYRKFKLRAQRETRILAGCNYFFGRTEWDYNITRIYSPNSKYFYCSEALRDSFIKIQSTWQLPQRKEFIIVSTISEPLYKGFDLILKTSKILKNNFLLDFKWKVFGVSDARIQEWKSKTKSNSVNVILKGIVDADLLTKELLESNVYVHPSYIDNSPNSICEAQYLGMPVIAANVGGISSLIEHSKNGLLVPSNDPYTCASYIKKIVDNKNFALEIGNEARKTAQFRHDPQRISADLISAYKNIIQTK
jgi:glycosyltransferase involved in cell wall biosynthesis